MNKLSPIEEINQRIGLKEFQLQVEKEALIDEIMAAAESLRPLNLIKQRIKNVLGDSSPMKGVMNEAMGYLGGILAKNIFVGKSDSILREIEGAILQMIVSSKVTSNAE